MKSDIKTPRDFLNPLLAKKSIDKTKFDAFKSELNNLKNLNQKESEEHQKNSVRDFLHKSFDYVVNTKERIDLAIFKATTVEVIIEAKSLDNKAEMITTNELNRKAFQEAIKYFFDERKKGNNYLKHIIILTAFEWFVFDAKDFEKLFWQDKDFKKIHDDYTNPNSLLSKTGDVYNEIGKLVASKKSTTNLFDDLTIECAYFNLKDDLKEKDLVAIYKLLSPDSLLKEFNPNDANSLNREFYSELLYILGLEEVKNGSKKLISRSVKPQNGSFYENIADKLSQRGKQSDFETIIRLIIIWVNRILFLKLLESQIVSWNKNNEYKFLTQEKIVDFDALENLFFDVLAKKPTQRKHKEFDYIPYLNSSLFEFSPIENDNLSVSNLSDDAVMEYYAKTVIKDEKTNRKCGTISTLAYLFEFLDAYDFGSMSRDDIFTPTNKTLINASVLGLIFEKINGYKDGSFYTPSFITMYMARESISKSILDKCKDTFGIEANDITTLNHELIRQNISINAIDTLINSITICDPAVGSGHFLVSALNEIIHIKYQLGLYAIRGLNIKLANDELIVSLNDEWFEYIKPKSYDSDNHLLQKLLFEEKQRIIENQLFGVDINPNSTQITKLRLWIELLKNSYYAQSGELITLPNIDINIKTGNSLISRFDLKDEIKINNIKQEIKNYKQRVKEYKENLGTKKEVLASIENLKDKFRLTLKAEYKVTKELSVRLKAYVSEYGYDKLSDSLAVLAAMSRYGQTASLFGDEADVKKQAKMLSELAKLQLQIDEIEKGKIYEDAFEWRFEFPEVLDENGDFVGFDIVIGNPPYISLSKLKEVDYGRFGYEVFDKMGDILALFFERGLQVASPNAKLSYIVSNSWLKTKYGEPMKRLFEQSGHTLIANFEDTQLFDEATVESCITSIDKAKLGESKTATIKNLNPKTTTPTLLKEAIINADANDEDGALMRKIESKGKLLKEWDVKINYGIKTGFNEAFIIDTTKKEELIAQDTKNTELIKPLIRGRDVQKYSINYADLWLISTFPSLKIDIDKYPEIKDYLKGFGNRLEQSGEVGSRKKSSNKWFETQDNIAYFADFEKPKIVWAELSDVQKFTYDESGVYPDKTLFFMRGKNLKYLLGVLNSKLVFWYFNKIAATTGMGATMWQKAKLELLPIAVTNNEQPFIELVDKILTLKKHDPKADTKALENQIDQMVYKLYDLSDEEIAVVEGR